MLENKTKSRDFKEGKGRRGGGRGGGITNLMIEFVSKS